MALRGKPPEEVTKRLKLFMYGPAGVGKTTAAIQFPNSYIIDCERGSENYDKLIAGSGSVVFQTTDINEVITEVKALLTEKHDYRTLVIDPITTAYNDLLEKCEAKVGSDFGRHYGAANKAMKKLSNLIIALDMNVVVTAHAKKEYAPNLAVIGQTFEGWKQLDYMFDLVIELNKQKGKKARTGKVIKTRLESFPDEEAFEWSYQNIQERYSRELLEREAVAITFATPEQIAEMHSMLSIVRLPDGTVERWFARAGVDTWEELPSPIMQKCIDFVKARFPSASAA